MLTKIDKDFHTIIGLSKKIKVPEDLDFELAKELKIKM